MSTHGLGYAYCYWQVHLLFPFFTFHRSRLIEMNRFTVIDLLEYFFIWSEYRRTSHSGNNSTSWHKIDLPTKNKIAYTKCECEDNKLNQTLS